MKQGKDIVFCRLTLPELAELLGVAQESIDRD